MDALSAGYQDLLTGSYDCVDRIVLNGYFRPGHNAGGFRVWWHNLTGGVGTLDDTHLMRMAGRFSRRVRGWAKANGVPVVDCQAGERKHDLAEEYLKTTPVTQGVFLILVRKAQAPVWEVKVSARQHHLERKKPMPYVNHYSFHILDPDWGHVTIKISGHPPFPAQIMLNGHEFVACQAKREGIAFTKEGNCFTQVADAAGLAKIADTLSEESAIGRLSQVCDRWIYSSCLCFALDREEQEKSGFRYPYSNYQLEYSRNLLFELGGRMDPVFQALIDRSRTPLDLDTIKTILGYRRRPRYRTRKRRSAEWEVAVEKPTYDLTIFRLHCGKLTLKIYTKGERVLRIEAMAHNVTELDCGRNLERFPRIITELKGILERFTQALGCIDQCFIPDETLNRLPEPSVVGKAKIGGVDFNQARMRRVAEAVLALSWRPNGFTSSELAERVARAGAAAYHPRQAAYDLKKLRRKQMVERVGKTRRYQTTRAGVRSIAALVILREKAVVPLLAAAQEIRPSRGSQNPTAIDRHYETIRIALAGVLRELGVAA